MRHKYCAAQKPLHVVRNIGKQRSPIKIALHDTRKVCDPRRYIVFGIQERSVCLYADAVFYPKDADFNDAIIASGTRCLHIDNSERLLL